jgi:microcystin-dependent protein
MGQTTNYQLPYPEAVDPADVPVDVRELAERLDTLLMQMTPVGAPIAWLASQVPAGFIEFAGQTITSGQYPKLYALFGGTLPDLRGKFLFGQDGSHAVGSTGGETAHTLTAAESGMPAHSFQPLNLTRINQQFAYNTGGNVPVPPSYDVGGAAAAATAVVNVPAQNAAAGHNNMPPYRACRWITAAG